jgi:desulfoferrodoxin-like iron-binding protein
VIQISIILTQNSNKEVESMAVEKVGEKYRCNVCGNEVVVTKVGGGSLVCCGQDMERIELKTPEVINLPDAEG